jgi:hypothetical protein
MKLELGEKKEQLKLQNNKIKHFNAFFYYKKML